MSRRSPFSFRGMSPTYDTGKDLFALLFLVMLMLAMVFMTISHESSMGKANQTPKTEAGGKSLTNKKPLVGEVFFGNEKKLLIRFNDEIFDPGKDALKLIVSGYTIETENSKGEKAQALYIDYHDTTIDSKALSRGLAPLASNNINVYFPTPNDQ